jgi:hypothetical protein
MKSIAPINYYRYGFPVKSEQSQIGPKSKRPQKESQIGHIFQIE